MIGNGINKQGQTCAQAYSRTRTEIYEKVELLAQRLADTGIDCQEANWANVGSAEHIKELLDELLQFVG